MGSCHPPVTEAQEGATAPFPAFVPSCFVYVLQFLKLDSNSQLLRKKNRKNMIFNLLRFVRPVNI